VLITDQKVKVKWHGRNREWYELKNYTFTKINDEFEVNVLDLLPKANIYVDVQCDYCGDFISKLYSNYTVENTKYPIQKDCCDKCIPLKQKDINRILYGTETNPKNNIKSKGRKQNKYTFEEIKQMFLTNNFILVSTEYKNRKQKLEYVCLCHPEEGTQQVSMGDFIYGKCCRKCGYEKMASKKRLDYEYVKSCFENRGYILLENIYKNNSTNMKYVCPNHDENEQVITLNNLLEGKGCYYCGRERTNKANTKENHPNWKGGTTSIRLYLRKFLDEWKKDSMSHCGYKCVLTGSKNFDIHHLYGFDLILNEIFEVTGLELKYNISDYTI
jgi:hypothetical protein